jgi:putative thioredoxin
MFAGYLVPDMKSDKLLELSYTEPLIVDFWAPWCEPCLILEPILDELASENTNRWQLVKINIDEEIELAEHFSIRCVPTTCIFYKGKLLAKYNGLMWKKQFGEWIEKEMSK